MSKLSIFYIFSIFCYSGGSRILRYQVISYKTIPDIVESYSFEEKRMKSNFTYTENDKI